MSQLTVDVGDDATPRKLRRASTFATKTKTEPKTPSTPRFGHSQSLAPRERWERAATVSALVQPFAMLARRADYTELLTSVKEQLWLDSPVVARRLTVDSEQLQFSFAEREWTDLDRFLSTQDFLHDKLMSNNPKLKFEGVHGLWELAVDGDHRQHFSMEVLRVLVATLDDAANAPTQTCAAAALWCLASTAAIRSRMLAVHAVPGLLRMLMRCSLPSFGAGWGRESPPAATPGEATLTEQQVTPVTTVTPVTPD